MKLTGVIILVISLLTWAQAKQNAPKATERKPAETHGGVQVSNAQFEAAAKFALSEGGTLSRVMSVEKRLDCGGDSSSYFEVRYGGQSSQTGIESVDKKAQIVRVPSKKTYTEVYQKDPDYDGEYVAEAYSGPNCK